MPGYKLYYFPVRAKGEIDRWALSAAKIDFEDIRVNFGEEWRKEKECIFDRDQSGTINFQEFQQLWQYINQWKGAFDRYDQDRSGAIEGHELHRAFAEMGFNVSANFVSLVVTKFDQHARRSLRLDSFIQCCVMLRALTDAFKVRDTNLNGSITISYEDFMCMVLLNKP